MSDAVAFHRHLWVKLLLAYLGPVTLILAGIGYLAYRASWVSMESQLGEGLISVARTASWLVAKPRAMRLMPEDEESRTYLNLKRKLHEIQQAARVELIYLFDSQGRALVDSRGKFVIGQRIVKLAADRAELASVFAGRDQSSVLFSGNDARLYKTGFSPVWVDGVVRAAVGVDGSAKFLEPLANLGRILVGMSSIALVLVIGVSLLVSRLITRPLARLTGSARAMGAGKLDREILVETRDEIGVLAYTLNEMRKSIQDRDQTLQMMLAGIAHEVRNPLGGMALFLGLVKDELFEHHTALMHLKRIETELDYLSRVVNDFLDYARKRSLDIEELDPREEIEQIKGLAAHELEKAELELVAEVAEMIKTVKWDRERMRRVLHNLIRNAIQASPKGQTIRVGLKMESLDLVISVADRGSGIPEDQRDRVFDPFFTTRQQGTGLGLSLVKKIVEAHAGSIWLDSNLGRGTAFFIKLPNQGVRA